MEGSRVGHGISYLSGFFRDASAGIIAPMQWAADLGEFVRRPRVLIGISIIAAFALGISLGYFLPHSHEVSQFAIREYDQRFEFIRPLLICQINESEEAEEFNSLESKVEQIIAAARDKGSIEYASFYFRDLTTARWTGVNGSETYTPASLLKVPIMMAYFKMSEGDPKVLAKRYYYVENDEEDDLIEKPLLQSKRQHSVEDLIRAMIIQSDNSAMRILQDNVDQEILHETYAALGIEDPNTAGEGYALTAKQYGLFFRVLYNGTFLSRELSNRALELLAESEFDLGLRGGTPESVKVANKYGVRGFTEEDGSHGVELSDCGIVYESSSPYLLCVMTHGDNAYVLADVIKSIAATTYQSVITERGR